MSHRIIPADDKLIELYVKEKLSCKAICRKCNINIALAGNIGRKLRQLGVQIRRDAGENHHNWKGGRIVKGENYIGIWNPMHERADGQGYVYEHTLVYEREKGILPKKGEVLHHIDMDKHNNSIENLYLCGNREHIEVHRSLEKLIPDLMKKGIIVFEDGIYKLK